MLVNDEGWVSNGMKMKVPCDCVTDLQRGERLGDLVVGEVALLLLVHELEQLDDVLLAQRVAHQHLAVLVVDQLDDQLHTVTMKSDCARHGTNRHSNPHKSG